MKTTGDELLDRMAVFLVRLYASRSCFISEADWQKVFADYDARAEATHSTPPPTSPSPVAEGQAATSTPDWKALCDKIDLRFRSALDRAYLTTDEWMYVRSLASGGAHALLALSSQAPKPASAGGDVLREHEVDEYISAHSICPMCGKNYPHTHPPHEVVVYRNGVKYGRALSSQSSRSGADEELTTC